MATPDDADKERLRREALVGAVDEDGDLTWFISPKSMRPRKPNRGGGETEQQKASAPDVAGAPE